MLFVLLQRYTFWRNSQPVTYSIPQTLRCLYYCKDTLFDAIHNIYSNPNYIGLLFVLLQRYTFWRNSQQVKCVGEDKAGCLYYCKDTLFEAIHN